MSEMIERVAKALFRSRYPNAESEGFWPDRIDETVNGPPFNADGYRDMARAAIEAMREPTQSMIDASPEEGVGWNEHSRGYAASYYRSMIDAALGKVDA